MSWNAPQTIREALESVRMGWSFQSRLGVKGVPIWVLTDITRDFHKGNSDDFGQDIVRRNWTITDRYTRLHTREGQPDDLTYVVGRDGVILAALLRNGTVLMNDRAGLPKRLQTFRDAAATQLAAHAATNGHLARTDT